MRVGWTRKSVPRITGKHQEACLIVSPIVRFCSYFVFCCALLCVYSSFAFILIGKRELEIPALLSLPSWYLMLVVLLLLAVS